MISKEFQYRKYKFQISGIKEISLSNCIFENFNSQSVVISVFGKESIVNIIQDYFFNSSSVTEYGGALSIRTQLGNILLDKTCGISCNSWNHAHFIKMYSTYSFEFNRSTISENGLLSKRHANYVLSQPRTSLNYVNVTKSLCSSYAGGVYDNGYGNSSFCIYESLRGETSCIELRKHYFNLNYFSMSNNTVPLCVLCINLSPCNLSVFNSIFIDNVCDTFSINYTGGYMIFNDCYFENTNLKSAEVSNQILIKFDIYFGTDSTLSCVSIPNLYLKIYHQCTHQMRNTCILSSLSIHVLYVFILL